MPRAVSFADRELQVADLQLSTGLPAELVEAELAAWPLDPGSEQRRPALWLHQFLNTIGHVGPERSVSRIEAVLDSYGW